MTLQVQDPVNVHSFYGILSEYGFVSKHLHTCLTCDSMFFSVQEQLFFNFGQFVVCNLALL